MKKTTNNAHVEGYVFSHKLRQLVSKKDNTPFISGDVNIATDSTFTNVVKVNFGYVTEFFKSGKVNATYQVLMDIINGISKTAEIDGAAAVKLRIDGSVSNNDFVTKDGEMVSPKQVRGQFAHVMEGNIREDAATFDIDMLINNVVEHEVEDGDDYITLSGCTFSFSQAMVPLDVNVRSNGGINYFMGLDISKKNPVFTHVKGEIVSKSVEREVTEESAFGDPIVRKVMRSLHTWDVTWAAVEPYEFGEEGVLTVDELKEKMNERQEYLASVQKRHDDYIASRDGGQSFETPKKAAPVVDDDDDEEFDF